MTAPTRRCSKCQAVKPDAEFKADRRKPDGLSSICKPCSHAASKLWRRANAAHVKAYAKEAEKGRIRSPAYRKAWRAKNRAKIKAEGRTEADAATRRAYNRAWERKNPGKVRANWAVKRARKSAAEGKHTAEDVARILRQQRGRCAYCRQAVGDEYHVDHIKALAKGGTNWPRNLQILCQPCNVQKHASDPLTFARKSGLLL